MRFTHLTKVLPTAFFLAYLSGCTVYQPLPLDQTADRQPLFLNDVAHISVDRATLSLPELKSHPFDASDGLDMTEVAMLAVANSPDLRIARDQANITRAQAFSAGLLHDPQLALSRDIPVNRELDLTNAFSAGLSYDFSALLLLSSNRDAADASARQADLDLLWQEWQIVAQARLLFSRVIAQRKVLAALESEQALSSARYQQMQRALAQGNVTADAANADLATLQANQTSIHDLEQLAHKTLSELHALLGLNADVPLNLVDDDPAGQQLAAPNPRQVQSAVEQLSRKRPDLLALRAGYASQEEKFRQAVLAQFPALNIGLTRARDTSDIYTKGIGINLSLPVFNRNRGNIAIEKATRERLFDEYQQRLNTAQNEVLNILDTQSILAQQLQETTRAEETLASAAKHADAAYRDRAIDSLAYVNLRNAWFAKQVERINLQQAMLEQRIALLAIIGGELSDGH